MTRAVEAQARRDTDRALELDRIIKGAQSGPNPLRAYADNLAAMRPSREHILANRQATREANKRRRLSRFAHLLCVELRAREIAGAGLHPEERGQLMTALTEIRRCLAQRQE